MDAIAYTHSFQRPLLVLLDRNVDLATPLRHAWTYQALLHDLMDYQAHKELKNITSILYPSPPPRPFFSYNFYMLANCHSSIA
jgi:hypothetical protein